MAGLSFQWEIPTIGEVPTMNMRSEKRQKESSDSFYNYRADVHFQIAAALASVDLGEIDMKGIG